jgi:anoctamin-10
LKCTKFNRQYLEEALGQEEAERAASGGIAAGEKIDRATLEGEDLAMKSCEGLLILVTEDARQSTLRGHGTPEER